MGGCEWVGVRVWVGVLRCSYALMLWTLYVHKCTCVCCCHLFVCVSGEQCLCAQGTAQSPNITLTL